MTQPHGRESLNSFLKFFNSVCPKIKVLMETLFPYVLVIKPLIKSLSQSVYRKPTHTDPHLHNSSLKKGIINTLAHRG